MAYTVNHTDVANKGSITVEDNTINQQTSLSLPGRNTTAYGCLLYTSPSPRDVSSSRMPSSA